MVEERVERHEEAVAEIAEIEAAAAEQREGWQGGRVVGGFFTGFLLVFWGRLLASSVWKAAASRGENFQWLLIAGPVVLLGLVGGVIYEVVGDIGEVIGIALGRSPAHSSRLGRICCRTQPRDRAAFG